MTPLAPGARVTPSVVLVRPLGAGGMGSVWLAHHETLKTEVVVKFMSTNLTSMPEAVARFSKEAEAASRVKSPHVVQMIDHGMVPTVDGPIPFIVMEKLDGHDLAQELRDRGRLAGAELVRIVAEVARALARAHEAGVVHRDIKPDNIFLCDVGGSERFVKVLDFGIAKIADHTLGATQTGAMLGTPYYMSPEQIIGARDIDHRTDLWSLGVVVFQALTGARPFDGETIGGLSIAITSGQLPMPSQYDPSLLFADAWFARACARQPQARFTTANEMASTFAAAVASASTMHASSVDSMSLARTMPGADVAAPLTEQRPAAPRRPPIALWFVLVGILVAGLGVGGYFVVTAVSTSAKKDVPATLKVTSKRVVEIGDHLRAKLATLLKKSPLAFDETYKVLKLYLMLGEPHRNLDKGWFEAQLPGVDSAVSKEEAVAISDGLLHRSLTAIELDDSIVEEARSALLHADDESAFAAVIEETNKEVAAITRESILYGSVAPYIQDKHTSDLEVSVIPGAYTKAGFTMLKPHLMNSNRLVERWVTTGDDTVESLVESTKKRMKRRELYFYQYHRYWRDFLMGFQFKKPEFFEQSLDLLKALTEPKWPHRRLLESLRDNTTLDLAEEETPGSAMAGAQDATAFPRIISPVEKSYAPLVAFDTPKTAGAETGLDRYIHTLVKLQGVLTEQELAKHPDKAVLEAEFAKTFREIGELLADQDGFTNPILSPLLLSPVKLAQQSLVSVKP